MIVHNRVPTDVRVSRELRAAIDAGFEVDVIALRGEGEPSRGEAYGATVYRLPVRHRYGSGVAAMAVEYVGFTLLAVAKATLLGWRRRYAIVQIHNPPDFLALAAIGPCALGARLIVDIHDLAPDMFHMRFEGRPGARVVDRLLREVERAVTRASSAVLTVHEQYRQELVARGVPESKVTVVMNSPDERILPSRSRLAVNDADHFRVVYHGTVTPHYGVDVLVSAAADAARDLEDIVLEVYGTGDAVEEIKALADHVGLGERFVLRPEFLPQAEVLRLVCSASVGVVPNLPTRLNRYALSTKLLEYVAMGVPVVCADLPTMRAHFSADEVLFYRAGDAVALAAALRQTASDPDASRARARAALRRFEEYRWAAMSARYSAVLHNLATRS